MSTTFFFLFFKCWKQKKMNLYRNKIVNKNQLWWMSDLNLFIMQQPEGSSDKVTDYNRHQK